MSTPIATTPKSTPAQRRGAYLAKLPVGASLALYFHHDSTERNTPIALMGSIERVDQVTTNHHASVVRYYDRITEATDVCVLWHTDGMSSGHRHYQGLPGRGYFVVADVQPDGTDMRDPPRDPLADLTPADHKAVWSVDQIAELDEAIGKSNDAEVANCTIVPAAAPVPVRDIRKEMNGLGFQSVLDSIAIARKAITTITGRLDSIEGMVQELIKTTD